MVASRRRVDNPYTERAGVRNPDHFFGRAEELGDIVQRLRGGQSVYLIGERRVGKSSILNALDFPDIREQFDIPPQMVFVSVDLQFIAGHTEELFFEYLLDQIAQRLGIAVPGPPSRRTLDEVTRLVSGRWNLVVLIDEFSNLVYNPNVSPEFLVFLRSWTVGSGVPIVGAFREGSLKPITEDDKFGSSFLNIFGQVYVGPLEPEDARELVDVPSANAGVHFSDDEVAFVFRLAGYLPLFVQIACYHLVELSAAGRSGEKGQALLERKFSFEALPHFEYLWNSLAPEEQQAAALLAHGRPVTDTAIGSKLKKKGVAVTDARGLRLASTIFEKLVLSRAEKSKSGLLNMIRE